MHICSTLLVPLVWYCMAWIMSLALRKQTNVVGLIRTADRGLGQHDRGLGQHYNGPFFTITSHFDPKIRPYRISLGVILWMQLVSSEMFYGGYNGKNGLHECEIGFFQWKRCAHTLFALL